MSQKKNSSPQHHQGEDNTAPYPVSRLAPGFSLVDMAMEIEQADAQIHHTTHARLQLIAEQMLKLKQQAQDILQQAQQDQQLHRAQCQFKKIPGRTYYLYKKPNGQLYFSMLSPQDWGDACKGFQGAYTLQADMSWKAEGQDTATEAEQALQHLLGKLPA